MCTVARDEWGIVVERVPESLGAIHSFQAVLRSGSIRFYFKTTFSCEDSM